MNQSRISDRQRDILEQVRATGEVLVEPLAQRYNVSPQTIRRDLNALYELQLLRRTHGGAIATGGVANLGYAARQQLATSEKYDIGRRAAELIPNDASLFVNIGTTTEQVAHHLTRHAGLLVITNNINVANLLRPFRNIDLMIAGGTVRREDGGIVGDQAVDFIGRFKVDYAVIGASAIESDGTLLDYDPREVRVAQAIISNARSVILVADHLKFDRNAPVRIGNISQVDYFVTDDEPDREFTERCIAENVRIEVAAGARVPAPGEPSLVEGY